MSLGFTAVLKPADYILPGKEGADPLFSLATTRGPARRQPPGLPGKPGFQGGVGYARDLRQLVKIDPRRQREFDAQSAARCRGLEGGGHGLRDDLLQCCLHDVVLVVADEWGMAQHLVRVNQAREQRGNGSSGEDEARRPVAG
ncbi:MAG: hypothetical protein AMXMBFR31_23510 [Candidatus Desulfobacillus denitrificans]|jgi:hypothetical protein